MLKQKFEDWFSDYWSQINTDIIIIFGPCQVPFYPLENLDGFEKTV